MCRKFIFLAFVAALASPSFSAAPALLEPLKPTQIKAPEFLVLSEQKPTKIWIVSGDWNRGAAKVNWGSSLYVAWDTICMLTGEHGNSWYLEANEIVPRDGKAADDILAVAIAEWNRMINDIVFDGPDDLFPTCPTYWHPNGARACINSGLDEKEPK